MMYSLSKKRLAAQANFAHIAIMEQSYHYHVIGRALNYIRELAPLQPSLDALAAHVGLSPSHFQRVFTEWVGVSPKTYAQHLALAHAKEALLARLGTLEAADRAALSGTGRLYDLVLKWEGVRPGEFAQGGAGLIFDYGYLPTPFGEALIVAHKGRLTALGFVEGVGREAALLDFCGRWPKAHFQENPQALSEIGDKLGALQGEVRLALFGSEFQIAIWRALLAIPEGQFTTYSHLAELAGKPKAQRAVGTAVGRNPISLLIPCHRAIRQSGALGGYHWGLPIKEAMIAYESARREAS